MYLIKKEVTIDSSVSIHLNSFERSNVYQKVAGKFRTYYIGTLHIS